MSRRHVLVVDDDPSVVELERALLENAGHQVETAVSTHAAVLLIEQNRYDVLVTDLDIGKSTDGFILVSLFKQANPNGTTIMNTGSSNISACLGDFQRSIDQVILKPTPGEAILEVVERAPIAELRPGRKRLSDLLEEHGEEIIGDWTKRVAADPVLNRQAVGAEERTAQITAVLEAVIGRIAEPRQPRETFARAERKQGKRDRERGYSPVATLLEMIHLQSVTNEAIERYLIFVNLGSIWHDILALNAAITSEALEMIRALEG